MLVLWHVLMQKQSWWCDTYPFDQICKGRISSCYEKMYLWALTIHQRLFLVWYVSGQGQYPHFFNEEGAEESWNHRLAGLGRDLEAHVVPTTLAWVGMQPTRSNCSERRNSVKTREKKKHYQSSTDSDPLFLPKVKWKSGFNSFYCSLISFCGGKDTANISGIQAVLSGDYWLKTKSLIFKQYFYII